MQWQRLLVSCLTVQYSLAGNSLAALLQSTKDTECSVRLVAAKAKQPDICWCIVSHLHSLQNLRSFNRHIRFFEELEEHESHHTGHLLRDSLWGKQQSSKCGSLVSCCAVGD